MKPFVPLFSVLVALTACTGPLSIYYHPGASVTRMQTVLSGCQVAALKDAPVANQVRQRPPIFIPGRQICGPGGCYDGPGYWDDGSFYTVDVNQDLRKRVETQCMAHKGFLPIKVPLCSSAVKSAVTPAQTRILPKLTENACSVRYQDGNWQIVNPVSPKSGG